MNAQISSLACPSDDGNYGNGGSGSFIGQTAYAGVHSGSDTQIAGDNDGVFYLNSGTTYQDVRDGSTSTFFFGEKGSTDLDKGLGWYSGTRATLRNTGTQLNSIRDNQERRGNYGRMEFTADQLDPKEVHGFMSFHTGGAHFGMGDGSVRFVSERTDSVVYSNLGNRTDGQILPEF